MAGPVVSAGPHLGRVASFDAVRGLGTVVDGHGAVYDFHATAIADGTRRIDVDAAVTFSLRPGHRGRFEARSLAEIGDGGRHP